MRSPQSEKIDSLAARSRYHHIVGYSLHLVAVFVCDAALSALPIFGHMTAEADVYRAIRARIQPCIPAAHPLIGKFYLVSVDYLLLEQPVFVAYRKARGGIAQCAERIHKASRKPSESSVSETGIGLHFID